MTGGVKLEQYHCCIPQKEIATNIRNILVRSGFDVLAVTTTGAQALHYVDTLDDGVIVCGYRLSDMMYSDIRGPIFRILSSFC